MPNVTAPFLEKGMLIALSIAYIIELIVAVEEIVSPITVIVTVLLVKIDELTIAILVPLSVHLRTVPLSYNEL